MLKDIAILTGATAFMEDLGQKLESATLKDLGTAQSREARVILGDSERQVAEKFGEAAKTYHDDPIPLHLRAMNMLYEGLKHNSTIVLVPSSALDTMQLGNLAVVVLNSFHC